MNSSGSWSSERVKIELEDTLENLARLENHLPEPLTLTESIGELETTLALYNQLTETEGHNG
ncbi:hypothetical protein [Saliphagus sp. LR7]|uniref:hypothetical protein n=1 Tax=Saliphagus sp. LR7 TaxID=2282654 RepID=UPI000DF7776D|nr:hypothetical protein [Saliphagus sp. LR7]